MQEFRGYSRSEDPLVAHQPVEIDCGVAGIYPERNALEIDTRYCNYALVAAPAKLAVSKGTTIEIALHHFDLNAPEPATAHLALLFDRDVQWETTIGIPSTAAVLHVSFEATRDLAEGEPVRLHLHNHGQNTWTLSSVRVVE
jgi:hypothetical protein